MRSRLAGHEATDSPPLIGVSGTVDCDTHRLPPCRHSRGWSRRDWAPREQRLWTARSRGQCVPWHHTVGPLKQRLERWQYTDSFRDAHTRAALLRGSSRYRPQVSEAFPSRVQSVNWRLAGHVVRWSGGWHLVRGGTWERPRGRPGTSGEIAAAVSVRVTCAAVRNRGRRRESVDFSMREQREASALRDSVRHKTQWEATNSIASRPFLCVSIVRVAAALVRVVRSSEYA